MGLDPRRLDRGDSSLIASRPPDGVSLLPDHPRQAQSTATAADDQTPSQRAGSSGSIVAPRRPAELAAGVLPRPLWKAAGAAPGIRQLEQLVELTVGEIL